MNKAVNAKQWRRVRIKALERDGWKCTVEGCGVMRALEVDHIKPICDGGEIYALSNLGTLCRWHHRSKTQLENTHSIPERDRLLLVLERVLTESV